MFRKIFELLIGFKYWCYSSSDWYYRCVCYYSSSDYYYRCFCYYSSSSDYKWSKYYDSYSYLKYGYYYYKCKCKSGSFFLSFFLSWFMMKNWMFKYFYCWLVDCFFKKGKVICGCYEIIDVLGMGSYGIIYVVNDIV